MRYLQACCRTLRSKPTSMITSPHVIVICIFFLAVVCSRKVQNGSWQRRSLRPAGFMRVRSLESTLTGSSTWLNIFCITVIGMLTGKPNRVRLQRGHSRRCMASSSIQRSASTMAPSTRRSLGKYSFVMLWSVVLCEPKVTFIASIRSCLTKLPILKRSRVDEISLSTQRSSLDSMTR